MEPNAHRSRSVSDVASVSTVSVLSCYTIRDVRAMCIEEPRLGWISSGITRHRLRTTKPKKRTINHSDRLLRIRPQ